KFGDQAILQQVLGFDVTEDFALLAILWCHDLGAEADRGRTAARRNDLLEPGESPTANKQDIGGVNLEEFLLRMLAAALWRHARNGSFHDFKQRLLYALARHVTRNRRIVGFARDLVDLVDVDDTTLRALDIVVGRLQ